MGWMTINDKSSFTQMTVCNYCVLPMFSRSFIALMARQHLSKVQLPQGPACLAVKPLGLHVVNVDSIPTGATHGEA